MTGLITISVIVELIKGNRYFLVNPTSKSLKNTKRDVLNLIDGLKTIKGPLIDVNIF